MAETETPPAPEAPPELTARDRCDHPRCGAQAYVRYTLPSGFLDFCRHHSLAHEAALYDIATDVQDETHKLFPAVPRTQGDDHA